MRKTYSPFENDPVLGSRWKKDWDEIRELLLRRVSNIKDILIVAEVKK